MSMLPSCFSEADVQIADLYKSNFSSQSLNAHEVDLTA